MNQICLEFFRRTNFPPEAIAAVSVAEEALRSVADFNKLQHGFFQDDATVWETLHVCAREAGIHPFTADLILLLSCIPEAKLRYAQAGIPENIYWDSMKDIRFKMEETHTVYDIWGVYCGPWLAMLLQQKCICLGRLQFEPLHSHCGCVIGEHTLQKGDLLLNVHIPSFGKLLYEDVLDAYRQAAQFFQDKFPNRLIWIQAETWILYPPVMQLLPEGNLRTWAKDYQVVLACIDPKQDDRYRIFQKPSSTPVQEYPEKNPLQRQLKAWLLEGNQMGIGFGYLLMKDGSLIRA